MFINGYGVPFRDDYYGFRFIYTLSGIPEQSGQEP